MRWRDADEDLEDREFPDEPEDDEDDETIPCPHCRRPVFEDAERCPGCGRYLSTADAPRRHPWWLVIGVLVCVWVVLKWLFPLWL